MKNQRVNFVFVFFFWKASVSDDPKTTRSFCMDGGDLPTCGVSVLLPIDGIHSARVHSSGRCDSGHSGGPDNSLPVVVVDPVS